MSKDVRTTKMHSHDHTADGDRFREMDRQTNAAVRRGVVAVLRQTHACDSALPASLERLMDALRKQESGRD